MSLLKTIIRESHLYTNGITNQIRINKLSKLDAYILTVDSNFGRFNQHVKFLIQSLTARNHTISDLLINLSKDTGQSVMKCSGHGCFANRTVMKKERS